MICGKLVDVQGQPATGVELQVWKVGRPTNIGTFDGVSLGNTPPPDGLRVWPRNPVTDDEGRFELTGIGRDVTVGFHIRDRRFVSAGFDVRTDDRDGPKIVTEALRPAIIVEGRVLAADTGLPVPRRSSRLIREWEAAGQGIEPTIKATSRQTCNSPRNIASERSLPRASRT